MNIPPLARKKTNHQGHLDSFIDRISAPCPGLIICLLIAIISFDVKALDTYEEYHQEASKRLQAQISKLQSQPETSQRNLELAHLYFFTSSIQKTKEEKLDLHQRGFKLAEQVLNTYPENKKAQLWSIVNELGNLRINKPFSAIWRLGRLEKSLIKLKKIDQKFEYAAADRVLAIIYAESPRLIIGSNTKARKHFPEALKIAPEFPANKILYAEFLIGQDELQNAQLLLIEVENDNALASYPIYEMLWKMDIYRMRSQLN